jgi:hypothetical protein
MPMCERRVSIMNDRNYLRNLVLKPEQTKLRKLLNRLRKKSIVFPVWSGITSNSIRTEMDKIILGGKVEVIGELKQTDNKFEWVPPEKHTLYALGGREDGTKAYFMIRKRKGKELTFAVYCDGSVEEMAPSENMINAIRKEIFS